MCPDFLQQWWQDVSESFFEGFIVGHLNVMLDLTGTPQLIIIQGENIMTLHQQFNGALHLLLRPFVQA